MAEKNKPRGLDAEDAAIWRRVSRTIKPLRKREPTAAGRPKPSIIIRQGAESAKTDVFSPDTGRRDRPIAESPIFAGLDKRTAQRLKRGKLPIEKTVDLHGLRQNEAVSVLNRELQRAHQARIRCLLVITGKGSHGPDSGILRRALPGWLSSGANAGIVLAWAPAQRRHGGDGAFYVLLRRVRE